MAVWDGPDFLVRWLLRGSIMKPSVQVWDGAGQRDHCRGSGCQLRMRANVYGMWTCTLGD